jgi:hypothetical protein
MVQRRARSGDQRGAMEDHNIGNNRPEELMHVVSLLEKEFDRKAIKEMLPMQPGDVPATYADIECPRCRIQARDND